VAVDTEAQVCSTGFTVLRSNDAIDPRYLFRWVLTDSFIKRVTPKQTGTHYPATSDRVVKAELVPLAPLNEQHRIVAKLEELLSHLDAAQSRLATIPQILKQFRQSVLAVACSGTLTSDWRAKNQTNEPASELLKTIRLVRLKGASSSKEVTQIQAAYSFGSANGDERVELPPTWAFCSIGAIGAVSNGSTPSRKVSNYWGGNISWVSSGEVRNNIISATRESITEQGFANSSVRLLPRGTVLLAMIGEGKTRGQSAILEIEATINQNIAAVDISHDRLDPAYLWRWFQYQYESTREQGSGSGPQALNCQRVRQLPLYLPPLAEQQEIVRRVEALFKTADALEARYRTAKAHIDKLTQSILAKAFRGELVPQDPNDEPASVLLEQIRKRSLSKKGSSRPTRKERQRRC
jgi:type I restriction enzyme S subunit